MNGGGDDGEDIVGESITPDDPLTSADPVKPIQTLISRKVTGVIFIAFPHAYILFHIFLINSDEQT